MLELVPQHVIPSYWSTRYKVMTAVQTDWTAIGKKLGRAAKHCRSKYRVIEQSQMKKGRFTVEEDALICQRVREWRDKGNGLWEALEKEMGRPGGIIRNRWRKVFSK